MVADACDILAPLGVSLNGGSLTNCDFVASGSAALIAISNTVSVSDGGGSLIKVSSETGVVQVSACTGAVT